MKKFSIVLLLLLPFLASCNDDDDPKESSKVVSKQEFMAAFSERGWQLKKVYDVYADGSKGPELLIRTAGYQDLRLVVSDEYEVRQVHTSKTNPNYFAVDTVRYDYDGIKGELTFGGGALPASLKETFTVESIDGKSMTCRGKVFSDDPEAAYSQYVFEPLSQSDLSALSGAWDDRQSFLVPVMVQALDKESFDNLFRSKVWAYRETAGLHEDGSLGEIVSGVEGPKREGVFVDRNGWMTEILIGADHSIEDINSLAAFMFGRTFDNSLDFSGATFESLRNSFMLLSISDKNMEILGWPSERLLLADPGAVRALYRYECITDKVE